MGEYDQFNITKEYFTDIDGKKYTHERVFEGIFGNISFGGIGGYSGDVPTPTGACPFKGKTNAQKFAMCGVTPGMSSAQARATGNIIRYSIPGQNPNLEYNKNVINDLIAIQNEVNQLGWFTFKIGNCFRDKASAGGKSRHQIGCAVDINPNSHLDGGNPWFNVRLCTHLQTGVQTPLQNNFFKDGDKAPWGKHPKWTNVAGWAPGTFIFRKATSIWDANHPVVKIFLNHGWGWGGAYGDVMHFSLDGG